MLDEAAGGEEILLTLDKENILPCSGPGSGEGQAPPPVTFFFALKVSRHVRLTQVWSGG